MNNMSEKTVVGRENYQEQRRKDTLASIQQAIDDMRAMNEEVTKSKLMEMTGLSSATFSKEHVKELLKQNRVCQYKEYKGVEKQISVEKQLTMENYQLLIQQQRTEKRRVDVELSRDKYKALYEKTKAERDSLANENELLRGRIHRILMEMKTKGYDLDTGWDII